MGGEMTFVAAARAILMEASEALHYREITERALKKGLLKTSGKTPEETLNARLCVEIKEHGEVSEFVRVAPGMFGLRGRLGEGQVPQVAGDADDATARVRVPYFPRYDDVRVVVPAWVGLQPEQVTSLYRTLTGMAGSPQETMDWSEPDVWIPLRLAGEQRELALKIWKTTKGKVNPRHMLGHWLLASRYGLLVPGAGGRLEISKSGKDFVDNPEGETVRVIDDREGLLKLLAILADRGQAEPAELWEPWRAFLDAESRIRSDSYARSTLYERQRNLLARGLVVKAGRATSITDAGLAWLRKAGVHEDTSGSAEEQDIWALAQRQKERVRSALLEALREMDPYAFERLIASLLDAMGYDDARVTSPSNDKGVDVVANIKLGISSVREVVQVKRHKGNIHRPVLDALRGSLHRFSAVRGTIITTGGFASGTVKAAFEPGAAPITLIDGDALVGLLMENNIGVRRRELVLWDLDVGALKAPGERAEE